MLLIAICDDDDNDIKRVNNYINDYKSKNDIEIKTFVFKDGKDLLLSGEKYDMIFLDIEMEHTNGIDIAQKIRESDMNVPIVYVTGYPDYWKRAYKVHAFDFVEKPFKYEDIEVVMNDFITSCEDAIESPVSFTTGDGIVVLDMNSIIYFWMEAKRSIKIYTIYKTYTTKESLSDIMNKIDPNKFYRTNKNFIVNFKYVQSTLDNDGITMKDGAWIPIAQKKEKDFYKRLSEQLRQI